MNNQQFLDRRGSFIPYGQATSDMQQQLNLQQHLQQRQQHQLLQQQQQQQQQRDANAYLNELASLTNHHACSEQYDPSLFQQMDTQQQSPYGFQSAYGAPASATNSSFLLNRLGGTTPNNVTVINHLNFNPTVLTADSFKNHRSTTAPLSAPAASTLDPLPYVGLGGAAGAPSNLYTGGTLDSNDLDPLLAMGSSLVSNGGTISPVPPVVSSADFSPTPISTFNNLSQLRDSSGQHDPEWLDEVELDVPAISLEKLSGKEVIKRVRACSNDVLTCYIPCVDFLVQCQQDLRKGLAVATQKRRGYGKRYLTDTMSPLQFYNTYIDVLPQQFWNKTNGVMDPEALNTAMQGLNKLLADSRGATSSGSEHVKNNFLGGMKDGESWGLRKWLSRNGQALRVCTQLESIMQACKGLEKELETTRKLADLLRPLAKKALDRLRNDIPSSYQEVSAAHPYLPFFHRLESSLRAMATFDPDDDDVICIDDDDDDDEIEVVKAPVSVSQPPRKRKRGDEVQAINLANTTTPVVATSPPTATTTTTTAVVPNNASIPVKVARTTARDDSSSSGESHSSIIEVVNDGGKKPAAIHAALGEWTCAYCKTKCPASFESCSGCRNVRTPYDTPVESTVPKVIDYWPPEINAHVLRSTADLLAENIEKLQYGLETGRIAVPPTPNDKASVLVWDGQNFFRALRILLATIREPNAIYFINPMEQEKIQAKGGLSYASVIKHPICFMDIASGLLMYPGNDEDDGTEDAVPMLNRSGKLPNSDLNQWNMWRGLELIQAIDLVFLNALAYGKVVGESRSKFRLSVSKMRKSLWKGVQDIVNAEVSKDSSLRKAYLPTKRSDNSGFIVYKR